MISGSLDRSVKEWDIRVGTASRSNEFHSRAVTAVCCDSGKVLCAAAGRACADRFLSQIVSGSADVTIKEWNRMTGDWRTIAGHTDTVTYVCCVIAAGLCVDSIAVWSNRCLALAGRHVLSGASDGSLRQWTLYYPM